MSENQNLNVVMGGSGGVGSAVVRVLAAQGKRVRAVNLSGEMPVPEGVEIVAADAMDQESTVKACEGASVVYHCVHPRKDYAQFVPMTENIIAGAQAAGAKLVLASSAYGYGKVKKPMTEDMPYEPEALSGEYHAKAAEMVTEAHKRGVVQSTIGRASNYFGSNAPRMWPGVDFRVAVKGEKASVIGDVDKPHTYTYVDDFAKGLITLSESDAALGETWHIPSAQTITTREFLEMVYAEAGQPFDIQAGNRLILTVMSWFNPDMKAALEVLYQFEESFILDYSKYERAFGAQPTSNEEAISVSVRWALENPA